MPIYKYECSRCGYEEEVLIFKGDLEPSCSKCLIPLTKVIGLSNFILKEGGVGWSKNGYTKGGNNGGKT